MHELTLAQNMLAIVEASARREGFCRVAAIRLEIGQLSCVSPAALRFCFDSVTRGTLADGARLDIDCIPGAGHCAGCGRDHALAEPYGSCPDCGMPLAVTSGTEMRVKELEVS